MQKFGKKHQHFVWDEMAFWSAKPEAVENYIRNKRALIAIADINGVSSFHFLQPCLFWGVEKKMGPTEEQALHNIRQKAPKLVSEAPVYFETLLRSFEELQNEVDSPNNLWRSRHKVWDSTSWLSNIDQDLYADPIHLNDDGQSILAQRIADKISLYLTKSRCKGA
jgi:lysophospholipase L1-like esterase